MTTDKKTLADVQPGGMVRLGDQAERARFEEWYVQNAFDYEANPIGSRDCALMRKAWNAALSAQPSPGGQGDARIPFETWAKDGGFDVSKFKGIYNSLETRAAWEAWLYWQRLAARQPVDSCTESECKRCRTHPDHRASLEHAGISDFRQPVTMDDALAAGYGTLHGAIDHWQERALRAEAELAARQPVGEPVGWYTDDHLTDRSATTYDRTVADRWRAKGWPVSPLYAAPPAQAVDLGQIPHGIRLIEIPRRNNLDPINVFVQDYELGRGRIVVTCYGQAWCGFWGAMGERTVMQFVAACDADYVAGNMLSGRHEHVKKHERAYVERIATEVIAEFRALIDSQAVGNG